MESHDYDYDYTRNNLSSRGYGTYPDDSGSEEESHPWHRLYIHSEPELMLSSFKISVALKLLATLRLNRLTVLGTVKEFEAYWILEDLIRQGNGWRELYFIAPDSAMLGFSKKVGSRTHPLRRPQPRSWRKILRERDGFRSDSSIMIYHATRSGLPGTALDPRMREAFEQDELFEQGELSEHDELSEPVQTTPIMTQWTDWELVADSDRGKELLVVVKRGATVDFAGTDQRDESFDFQELQELMPIHRLGPGKGKFVNFLGKEEEFDRYDDVDDYEWPTSNQWCNPILHMSDVGSDEDYK